MKADQSTKGVDWLSLIGAYGSGVDPLLGRNVGTSNFSDRRRHSSGSGLFNMQGMGDFMQEPGGSIQPKPPDGFELEPQDQLTPEDLKPKQISKGDTVTLRDGSRGEVAYVHPQMSIARVRVGGRTRTVNLKEIRNG